MEDIVNNLTLSTESYDEALDFLINKYGFNSAEVDTFYDLGKNDNAVQYAINRGYDIED